MEQLSQWLGETAADWMPRAMCVNGNPIVITLQIVGDLLIAFAYYALPILLWWFAKEKKTVLSHYRKVFILFGLFIFLCGTTHLFNVVMFWWPLYWIDSGIKIFTGIVSIMTLIVSATLLPLALQMQSPVEVEQERLELVRQQNDILKPIVENLTRTKAKLQKAEQEALVAQTETALVRMQIPLTVEKTAERVVERLTKSPNSADCEG